MIDYATAYQVERLKRTVNYLASVIAANQAALGTYGSGSLLTLAGLRAADNVTLQAGSVFVFADINGDPGVFYYDAASTDADDGLTVVVDAAARRWLRLGPIT
jgi:hypothetical protein